jgi:glycosyltransferase involved in cell wall biosynthesis
MIVCHLTSVHQPYDVRIFLKECRSLVKAGHTVHLVATANNVGTEVKEGVTIHLVKKPKNRQERFFKTGRAVIDAGLATGAEIYHLHDPELLIWVPKLKKLGKKVIYDSHEDLPRQIMGKPWIAKPIRTIVSAIVEFFENRLAAQANAVVTATPHIANRFTKVNKQVIAINNYPILAEFENFVAPNANKAAYVVYVGGIMRNRGILEMIKALEYTEARLALAGEFESTALLEECKQLPTWHKVDFVGFIGRVEVSQLIGGALAGMVVLHPLESYSTSLPIKMFEYAAAGVPVVASNFNYWQQLINEHNFGLTVNPLQPKDIAAAINKLLGNKALAAQMGLNGKQAVQAMFNWQAEEIKLIKLYNQL